MVGERTSLEERYHKVSPSIRKYIDVVEKAPDSNCFLELKKILKDKFLEAKMYFMLSIAEICTPFLLRFQTDAPAFPFLYEKLRSLLTLIGRKFLKKVVFHLSLIHISEPTRPY